MLNWNLKRRRLQPIGLDIGHSSIKMIQLAIDKEHVSIIAADKVRIDGSINGDEKARRSFVIAAIKQMLSEGKFRRRNVVSCLPNDKLKITSLRLAETEADKIEEVLKKEASERFGLDPEKDAIHYLNAGNIRYGDEVKNELILFAASDEAIRSHISMLEDAQLQPSAIDTIPHALFRSFERSRRREEDKEQTVVFVDIGSRFTTVVFGRGGEISFTKQIPIGGEKFNREIASKLGVGISEAEILREKLQMENAIRAGIVSDALQSDQQGQDKAPAAAQIEQNTKRYPTGLSRSPLDISTQEAMTDAISATAEELAKEISLCLRYYTVTFRGKRVEHAVFSGGGANERILLNVLKRHLAIDIEVAQPLKGLDIANLNFDNDKRGLHCEWAVAMGLGLKGWEDKRQL
jgi:type IV pilus assembly protein PilM